MLRLVTILGVVLSLSGCSREPKDPQQVEFEKKFEREAVLVKTCPGDPRYASGPTAITQRVYRFENELWYWEGGRASEKWMQRLRRLALC